MKKLLLHVCCAPCASACVERLLEADYGIVLFFSNSNIQTREEFEKRLFHVRRLAEIHRLELIADEYDHPAWLQAVSAVENYAGQPEGGYRCRECFAYSLGRTAETAKKLAVNFATSLTVSPHKNSRMIFEVGGRYAGFEPWDFKKKDGFKRSIELSKLYGFYRQNFCGCEFSFRTEKNSPAGQPGEF